jgi:hypothetical protein
MLINETPLLAIFRRMNACEEAADWLIETNPQTVEEALTKCTLPDWIEWLVSPGLNGLGAEALEHEAAKFVMEEMSVLGQRKDLQGMSLVIERNRRRGEVLLSYYTSPESVEQIRWLVYRYEERNRSDLVRDMARASFFYEHGFHDPLTPVLFKQGVAAWLARRTADGERPEAITKLNRLTSYLAQRIPYLKELFDRGRDAAYKVYMKGFVASPETAMQADNVLEEFYKEHGALIDEALLGYAESWFGYEPASRELPKAGWLQVKTHAATLHPSERSFRRSIGLL